MAVSERHFRRVVFPLLMGLSLAAGLLIPAFYDWTGSDQSRPSPLIGVAGLLLLVGGIVVCLLLPWLPLEYEPNQVEKPAPFRFTLRALMAVTAAIAMFVAALMKWPMLVSGCWYGLVFCYVLRTWIRFPSYRWPTAALLACMALPFIWLLTSKQAFSISSASLGVALGLPAVFPTMIVGALVRRHGDEMAWLMMLLAGVELAVGVWMIRLGPKRALGYLTFVLILSICGSFILNALVRI